jgi:PKD repeat protein
MCHKVLNVFSRFTRTATAALAAAVLFMACGDDRTQGPSNTPPTPAFRADCQWLTCTFVDSSTDADGRIETWAWDFGDSAASTLHEPTHVYATAGQFTVTLLVSDNEGAKASTTQRVSVNQDTTVRGNTPPTAEFSVSCGGLSCRFTDRSLDPDSGGRVVSWAWDFGDGGTSSEPSPIHPYASPGQFTVVLSVTDDLGDTASTVKRVTVRARDPSGTYERETPHTESGHSSRYEIRNDGSFELQDRKGSDSVIYTGTWKFATSYMGTPIEQDAVILLDFDGFESTNLSGVEGIGSFVLDGHLAIGYGAVMVQAGLEEGVYTTSPGSYSLPPPQPGQIAFVRDGTIYLANTDGSGLIPLTQGPEDYGPAWSRDGRRLAFYRGSWGQSGLYIMDADGSNVVQRAASGRDPTWSPDGKWIAFTCGQRICKVSADDGTDPIPIYGDGIDYLDSPAWSPLGDRIAFTSDAALWDILYDIWTVAPDGSGAIALRQHSQEAPNDDGQYQPAWSPDGSRIALVECPWAFFPCSSSVITVMNADGSGLSRLVATSGHAGPTWSADGQLIVFGSRNGIEWVSADGSARGLIISNGYSPEWRP